jgi:hypothetical protein
MARYRRVSLQIRWHKCRFSCCQWHQAKENRPSAVADPANAKNKGDNRPRNYSWAQLLKRVFEIDVLKCPRCGGRMRILAAINPPEAIHRILDCLGLPTRPPPIAAASTAAPYFS